VVGWCLSCLVVVVEKKKINVGTKPFLLHVTFEYPIFTDNCDFRRTFLLDFSCLKKGVGNLFSKFSPIFLFIRRHLNVTCNMLLIRMSARKKKSQTKRKLVYTLRVRKKNFHGESKHPRPALHHQRRGEGCVANIQRTSELCMHLCFQPPSALRDDRGHISLTSA
jgi:hypothetical protein